VGEREMWNYPNSRSGFIARAVQEAASRQECSVAAFKEYAVLAALRLAFGMDEYAEFARELRRFEKQ